MPCAAQCIFVWLLGMFYIGGCSSFSPPGESSAPQLERPNILWVSAKDMGPRLGSYGDAVARTPNIDALAAAGTRYTHAFTTAGVCSPSRAAIITGMHQVSVGAHHMRTLSGAPFAPAPTPYSVVPPHYVKTFTEYLRAAGYNTTNNVKEDYQFETPVTAWDECADSCAHVSGCFHAGYDTSCASGTGTYLHPGASPRSGAAQVHEPLRVQQSTNFRPLGL